MRRNRPGRYGQRGSPAKGAFEIKCTHDGRNAARTLSAHQIARPFSEKIGALSFRCVLCLQSDRSNLEIGRGKSVVNCRVTLIVRKIPDGCGTFALRPRKAYRILLVSPGDVFASVPRVVGGDPGFQGRVCDECGIIAESCPPGVQMSIMRGCYCISLVDGNAASC
jgi:hypothetical protein